MPVEPFDVTDENGVRVTGTAEAFRDPKGPFYDPNSKFYQNPRYSDHDISYLNTRDVCRINPEVLSHAVQEAFRAALIKFGMPDPKEPCALHPNKYVSNQPPSSTDSEVEKPVGDLSRSPPNSGAQPLNFASARPQVAFPLEALLSP